MLARSGSPILAPSVDHDVALREAAIRHCRLLSLQWGEAIPAWELSRGFTYAAAQTEHAGVPSPTPSVFSKAYAETVARARLHQAHVTKETLAAYAGRRCVCELRERPLLDAAHIVPDRPPEG